MSERWKIKPDTSNIDAIRERLGVKLNKGYWLRSSALDASINQKELQKFEKLLNDLEDGFEFEQKDFKKIIKNQGGLLTCKDETVLVYIKDHIFISVEKITARPEDGNRVHLTWCRTVEEKSKLNIDNESSYYTRFVSTKREDGLFKVETSDKEKYFAKLYPCQNCLNLLQPRELKRWGVGEYKKNTRNKTEKIESTKNFNFSKFLDDTKGSFRYRMLPEHTDKTQPMNVYGPDFRPNAIFLKEKYNYKCQDCGVDLKKRKELLHAHHIKPPKSESSIKNLLVLCIDCHLTIHHDKNSIVAAKHKQAILECRAIKREQGIKVD